MGIHTWLLIVDRKPESALALAEQNRDSAFILMCQPDSVTSTFLEYASMCTNLMVAVRAGAGCEEACTRLREARLLYAVCFCYDEHDVERIENGEFFEAAEQLNPVFTVLYAAKGCTQAIRNRVWQAVKQIRNSQCYQTIAWELGFDVEYIDSIISSESCSAGFNMDGYLVTTQYCEPDNTCNLFQQDLPDILKQAFPKFYVENNMA